jgi:DNA-binding GntR family transcriptional regulator
MHAKRHHRRSVLDEAYDSLKRSIVEGAYRPGQRLRALRVAKELKVSRTPVKEALARLEQEGLVAREQDSGYIVRGLSVSEILNLYKVREALELEAAGEALPNLTDEAFDAMREALDRADDLLAQKKYADFLRANRKFHNLIVAQTRNSILQEVLSNLDARFWSIGTIVVSRHPQRVQDIRRENRAILDALIGGDVRIVDEAVKAHVRGAAANVRLFIENETQHLFIVAA